MSRGEAEYERSPLWVTLRPDPVWAFLEERDISQNELARPGMALLGGRGATTKRLPERLASYRRYFQSGRARLDHEGRSPVVLFVFESEHAEEAFLRIASDMPGVPLASATVESIGFDGPLGAAWRLPAPAAPERRRLHFLATGDKVSEGRSQGFQ
ncbi:MAG: hypothetical protein OXE43_01395 [Chloroflexi bacterium]|nr:hypothetical protein [Chloroflexota bacterium]